mgnify:CR=1 FL=1
MSIELKQAAQRALNALDEATTYTGSPSWSPSMTDECIAAASALRTALAQQPATTEPVTQWQKRHRCGPAARWQNTDEHDAKWWRENAKGWEVRALYTRPAPSVPDDVARNAERYRWLRLALADREKGVSHHFCSIRYSEELDEAIDAAMLAAKEGGAA